MKISFLPDGIALIAKNDAEAALLTPIADAINAEDSRFPAQLTDNLESGAENRIINGVLSIETQTGAKS